MKKIAFYCADYAPSETGYSFAFQGLVHAVLDNTENCEIDVFTPVAARPDSPDAQTERLRVVRFHMSHAVKKMKYLRTIWHLVVWPWRMARAIAEADARFQYDFVVFESIDDVMVFLYLPNSAKKKTIIRVHGAMETECTVFGRGGLSAFKKTMISRVFARHARVITATTPFYLDFVRKWYLGDDVLLAANKVFCVVPNTIRVGVATKPAEHFQQPRFKIMSLGRMDAQGAGQKGFLDLLLALSMLRPETRSKIHLTLIGRGEQRPSLMTLAEGMGDLEATFIESVSNEEVGRHLTEAHAVVLASRYEGMSVFAMEALARGCPVIYAEVGGLKGMVDGNGYSFPPGSPEDLAAAMENLLALTPNELAGMSRKSNEVFSRFSAEHVASKLLLASKFLVQSPG